MDKIELLSDSGTNTTYSSRIGHLMRFQEYSSLVNMDYKTHEDRLSISKKFFDTLPGMTTVPMFTPERFNIWSELMISFLRGSHGLDTLIGGEGDRELIPVRYHTESEEEHEERVDIFNQRNLALYLIIDKAITANKDIDPKYRALASTIYKQAIMTGIAVGQTLYDELSKNVKGSPLHARINAINDLIKLKMERLGQEQHLFNMWKRAVETLNSLQIDVQALYRMVLIGAIGHIREHNSVMVALASLPPHELVELSPEMILSRFLANAEHSKGLRRQEPANAMFAGAQKKPEATAQQRREGIRCYHCGKHGHFASDCRSKKEENSKKARKA